MSTITEKRIEKIRLQFKRGTALDWHKASEAATPFIPKQGESIFYTDLNMLKIGDGVKTPDELPFLSVEESFKKHPTSTNNCNLCTEAGMYVISSGSTIAEESSGGNLIVMPNANYISQMLFAPGTIANPEGVVYFRLYTQANNTWSDWERISTSKHFHSVTFTPEGTVSAPDINIDLNTTQVVKSISQGSGSAELKILTNNKRLSFELKHSHVPSEAQTETVVTGVTAALANNPVFTGTPVNESTGLVTNN